MAKSGVVSVAETAILLVQAGEGGQASVWVNVPASDTVYIGGEGVTTADGVPFPTGLYHFRVGPKDKLYAVAESGTVSVAVLVSQLGFE